MNGILQNKGYLSCIDDIIHHEKVVEMKNHVHHNDFSTFEHSLHVSYTSYLICRRIGLNYRSAARGGLLHDLFLYDWHKGTPYRGLHAFIHPKIALQNASRYFGLNNIEREIILKHMWPLTIALPRYMETYVVATVDKCCAVTEFSGLKKKKGLFPV